VSRTIKFAKAGGPEVLEFIETQVSDPGPHEVRIKVKAIGLNRAESMWRNDKYVEPVTFPAGLGYEAAGFVDAVGKDVAGIAVGDTVSTIPFFSMKKYPIYGEVVIVPDHVVVKHPTSLSFAEAASIWMMFITAYGALVVDAKVTKGDFVIIPAASSSVGLAAVQIANYAGATSIALTRTSEKKKRLLEAGAAHVIATDEQDVVAEVMRITDGKGARVAFDPVGGANFSKLISALAFEGVVYIYGALDEAATPIPVLEMIAKMPTVKGYSIRSISGTEASRKASVDYILGGWRPVRSSLSSIGRSSSTTWWKRTAIWSAAASSARSSSLSEKWRRHLIGVRMSPGPGSPQEMHATFAFASTTVSSRSSRRACPGPPSPVLLRLRMTNAIFEFSVPVFERHLKILAKLLKTAETHAQDSKIEPATLISARLTSDMYTLGGQVRAACDTAKRSTARLIGLEPPRSQDTDESFADLQERIRDALGYLASLSAKSFAGSERRKIEFPFASGTVTITTQQYLTRFSLPNFYFHVVTAYDILRHSGVAVGKNDFLGSLADSPTAEAKIRSD
jgi:NADPH:quinone reductase-like Zn-dependent oxidoreductase